MFGNATVESGKYEAEMNAYLMPVKVLLLYRSAERR